MFPEVVLAGFKPMPRSLSASSSGSSEAGATNLILSAAGVSVLVLIGIAIGLVMLSHWAGHRRQERARYMEIAERVSIYRAQRLHTTPAEVTVPDPGHLGRHQLQHS